MESRRPTCREMSCAMIGSLAMANAPDDMHARILADVQRLHGGEIRAGKLYPLSLVVDNTEDVAGLDPGVGWFAVHTKPLAEFVVEEGLRKIGFQTFLPTILRRVSHGRKVIERTRALFPRYVFVGFNPTTAEWGPILRVEGVSRMLARGDHPLPIPDRLITKIMIDDLLKTNVEFIDKNAPIVEQRRPRVKGKAYKSWKGRKARAREREAKKRTKGMAEWLQKASGQ